MAVEQEFWPVMWRPCRPASSMPMLSAYSIAVCTRVGNSVGGARASEWESGHDEWHIEDMCGLVHGEELRPVG